MAITCVVLYSLLSYEVGASVISETLLFITRNCCVVVNTSLTQNIRLCLADFLFIFPCLMVYKVIVSIILYKLLFYHRKHICNILRVSRKYKAPLLRLNKSRMSTSGHLGWIILGGWFFVFLVFFKGMSVCPLNSMVFSSIPGSHLLDAS